jgi:hypothetical protein
MYRELLEVISDVTKDLSEVTPSTYDVRNALASLRRERSAFVARGAMLFPPEATNASGETADGDSEGESSQNSKDAIAGDCEDSL